jgi:hypothetical protein
MTYLQSLTGDYTLLARGRQKPSKGETAMIDAEQNGNNETVARRNLLVAAGASLAAIALAPSALAAQEDTSQTSGADKALQPANADEVAKLLDDFRRRSVIEEPSPEQPADDGRRDIRFGRSQEEQALIAHVAKQLHSLFGVTPSKSELTEALRGYFNIQSGFAFAAHVRDDDFLALHIEPLLDQAADLLHRALKDRATFDDLGSRMFSLVLEIYEFLDLDAIHQEEEANGLYDVAFKRSKGEYEAEHMTEVYESFLKDQAQFTLDTLWNNAKFNEVYAAAQLSGWIQGLVPYSFGSQSFNGYVTHTFGSDARHVADHGFHAAAVQSLHSLFNHQTSINQQRIVHVAGEKISNKRVAGMQAQFFWDAKNANFLRRRTLVARNYQDQKLLAAVLPDGVLNLAKRLPSLKQRFQMDLRDAVARMIKVKDGLAIVYGYDSPLPDPADTVNYYDNCIMWVREAIQWLIRFSRREQSCALPISVRGMLGERNWRSGAKTGSWTFHLPVKFFKDMAHVRLRGISAYVVEGPCRIKRLWRLEIQVPPKGTFVHLDGSSHSMEQSSLSECILSRVTTRSFIREPDMAGLSSLHNASPIGSWTVKVADAVPYLSSPSRIGAELQDIQIDCQIAFRRPDSIAVRTFN